MLATNKGDPVVSIIDKWASAVAQVASKAFEVSAAISNHSSILGDARESFIRDVLSKFLPATVHVGTGQIVDAQGKSSKQIDVIIYRKDFPILRSFGNADVYLIEGVLATVEVKSTLTKAKLAEALENGRSVKNLRVGIVPDSIDMFCQAAFAKSYVDLNALELNSLSTWLLPPHYIFAYQGYPETQAYLLAKHVDAWTRGPLNAELGTASDTTEPTYFSAKDDVAEPTNVSVRLDLSANAEDFTAVDEQVESCDVDSTTDEERAEFRRILSELMLNDASEFDEMDPSVLPHIIATHGTVGVLNLNNVLGLENEKYAFGVRAEQNPLRVLISHLLMAIFERTGWHRLGATGIQYALDDYAKISSHGDANWIGCVENYHGIRDAKQLLADRLEAYLSSKSGQV